MNIRKIGVALLVSLCSAAAAAEQLQGKVIAVVDGDTVDVLTADYRTVRVRLAEADAPETAKSNSPGQPFGTRSEEHLKALVHGKQVQVEIETVDRYGRPVGTVFVNGKSANLAQVRNGMAFVYDKYVKNKQKFYAAEAAAFKDGIGVWSQCRRAESHADCRERIEKPWDFRRSKN